MLLQSGIRRRIKRVIESSSDSCSDVALPKRPYQDLLEAFRLRHCISIDMADGTKLDNGALKAKLQELG